MLNSFFKIGSKKITEIIKLGRISKDDTISFLIDDGTRGAIKFDKGKLYLRGSGSSAEFVELVPYDPSIVPSLKLLALYNDFTHNHITASELGLEGFGDGLYFIVCGDNSNIIDWTNPNTGVFLYDNGIAHLPIRDYNNVDQGTIDITYGQIDVTRNPNNITCIRAIYYLPFEE